MRVLRWLIRQLFPFKMYDLTGLNSAHIQDVLTRR